MTIAKSDRPCPDCGAALQVVYVSEREQVVSGWACPECGYLASNDGTEDSVAKPETREYVLRVERSLSSEDVRDPLSDVTDEFRARARAEMSDDEVWLLLDPEDGSVVDAKVGDSVDES